MWGQMSVGGQMFATFFTFIADVTHVPWLLLLLLDKACPSVLCSCL